jgi:hypothetical protein
MDEAFAIGRHAGVPVVISHFRWRAPEFRPHEAHDPSSPTMARQPLGVDVYPYAASSTVLDPHYVAEAPPHPRHLVEGGAVDRPPLSRRHREGLGVDRAAAANGCSPRCRLFLDGR